MSGNADNFFEWERFPSALKHQIVAGYLTEAFPVLLQHFKTDIVYADLFAGAGRYEDGRPGSPLIAADLVQQIGAEARDLILMFNIRGVQRIAHAKAAEDIERGGSVDLGGTPALPASNYFQRPNEVLGGRWWQELLLDGRLPEERFPDLVEGYCEQLR